MGGLPSRARRRVRQVYRVLLLGPPNNARRRRKGERGEAGRIRDRQVDEWGAEITGVEGV